MSLVILWRRAPNGAWDWEVHVPRKCLKDPDGRTRIVWVTDLLLDLLSDRIEGSGQFGGAGVPSDHLPTQTRKIVDRSSGSSAAITGEPGRLAPQYFAASP